jgi:hypothetical protein
LLLNEVLTSVAVSVVIGTSLVEVYLTMTLPVVQRLAVAVTVKGLHAHRAYRAALAVNGNEAPFAYALLPFEVVAHPSNT